MEHCNTLPAASGDVQFVTIPVQLLTEPYPPKDFFMTETAEINEKWVNHLKTIPLSDARHNGDKHRECQRVDPNKWVYVVAETEERIVYIFTDEENGKIVLVVAQNVIANADLVELLNNSVFDQINKAKREMRDDDPGKMIGVGYSSGQLSSRSLNWAKNLKDSVKNKPAQHYKMSCIFAHAWNYIVKLLPQDIVDDYDNAAKELGGLTMDGGAMGKGVDTLRYTLPIDGEEMEFEVSELAPASGSCARNYARYTHKETNLNEYCVSYTTSRTKPREDGGNFYLADYGILVPGRADQMVAWRGKNWHGTTLALVDPTDKNPEFNQSGVAFILPSKLKAQVDKFDKEGFKLPNQITHMTIDDSGVKPNKLATMAMRVRKEDTAGSGARRYKKDIEIDLSAGHRYQENGKLWTKAQLLKEVEKRNDIRDKKNHIHAPNWWSLWKLVEALLKDDGVLPKGAAI